MVSNESTESTGSAVYLSLVDDFASSTASQACVNPLFSAPAPSDTTAPAAAFNAKSSTNHGNISNESTATSSIATSATAADGASAVIIPKQRKRRPRALVAAPESGDFGPTSNPVPTPTTTTSTTTTAVTATIADCLACSGCVTTAETVLLSEQHSLTKLKQVLQQSLVARRGDNGTKQHSDIDASMSLDSESSLPVAVVLPVVVTLSPAAWADLSRHWQTKSTSSSSGLVCDMDKQQQEPFHRQRQMHLVALLHDYLGVSAVLDGNIPRQWTLQASAREFCQAYRQNNIHDRPSSSESSMTSTKMDNSSVPLEEQYERRHLPSVALSSRRTQFWLPPTGDGQATLRVTLDATKSSIRTRQVLPIVTASCPAVTCLVEKSVHEAVPHLSTVVSPMMAAAAFWSGLFDCAAAAPLNNTKSNGNVDMDISSTERQATRRRYFHLAVMPCHDKKLEASRKDFMDETDSAMSSTDGGQTATETTQSLRPRVDMVITTTELWQLLQEACTEGGVDLIQALQAIDQQPRTTTGGTRTRLQEVTDFPSRSLFAALQKPRDGKTLPILYVASHHESASCNGSGGERAVETATMVPSFYTLGSGGYADFLFRYAAHDLFGLLIDAPPHTLWRPVDATADSALPLQGQQQPRVVGSARMRRRRREYYEAVVCGNRQTGAYFVLGADTSPVSSDTVDVVLRFAIAYGMQTVQGVLNQHVQQQPHHQDPPQRQHYYDYIEAMACAGSCLNGGGQLRLDADRRETPTETRLRIAATQQHFVPTSTAMVPPMNNGNGGTCDNQDGSLVATKRTNPKEKSGTALRLENYASPYLYTRFHVVPPMQHSFGAAAGVAVEDTVW